MAMWELSDYCAMLLIKWYWSATEDRARFGQMLQAETPFLLGKRNKKIARIFRAIPQFNPFFVEHIIERSAA